MAFDVMYVDVVRKDERGRKERMCAYNHSYR